MDVWKLHFTRVFGLVNGPGHRSKFEGALIDDGGEGQEMLNSGEIEGKRNGGEGSRVSGDGRKSEGGQGNMMRRMENEDTFSVNVQSQWMRIYRCIEEYRWRRFCRTYALDRSRLRYAQAAHGPEYAYPACGEMTTREAGIGVCPIPGNSLGTLVSHPSSCAVSVGPEEEYQEPEWWAPRVVMVEVRLAIQTSLTR